MPIYLKRLLQVMCQAQICECGERSSFDTALGVRHIICLYSLSAITNSSWEWKVCHFRLKNFYIEPRTTHEGPVYPNNLTVINWNSNLITDSCSVNFMWIPFRTEWRGFLNPKISTVNGTVILVNTPVFLSSYFLTFPQARVGTQGYFLHVFIFPYFLPYLVRFSELREFPHPSQWWHRFLPALRSQCWLKGAAKDNSRVMTCKCCYQHNNVRFPLLPKQHFAHNLLIFVSNRSDEVPHILKCCCTSSTWHCNGELPWLFVLECDAWMQYIHVPNIFSFSTKTSVLYTGKIPTRAIQWEQLQFLGIEHKDAFRQLHISNLQFALTLN